jgi:copper(I)-binding protein
MSTMRILIALLLTGLASALQAQTTTLEFSTGWIKQLPPSIPVRAGYLKIDNPGKLALRIDSISSPLFDTVEMHESKLVGDVLSMVELEDIELPAGQGVEMRPGGKHLMLIGPRQALNIGDMVEVVINFADGSSRSTLLEVRP